MVCDCISISKFYNLKGGELKSFIQNFPFNDAKITGYYKPTIVICPGGNYEVISERESEPVALKFLAQGYNVFILKYLTFTEGVCFPEELLELACSIDYIKTNYEKYHVNKNEIFVIGFSAGGHLAGSLSTDYTIAQSLYKEKILDCEIKAAGLIYPVISDEYGFKSTHERLLTGSDIVLANTYQNLKLDKLVNEKNGSNIYSINF